MTLDTVLRRIEVHGDAAAELDRWVDARDLSADEALLHILDVPVESAPTREAILNWYLRRSGAAREPSPLAVHVAVALLTAALPGDDAYRRVTDLLAREHAAAGVPAPAGL